MRLSAVHVPTAASKFALPGIVDRLLAFAQAWLRRRAVLAELHGLDERAARTTSHSKSKRRTNASCLITEAIAGSTAQGSSSARAAFGRLFVVFGARPIRMPRESLDAAIREHPWNRRCAGTATYSATAASASSAAAASCWRAHMTA